MPDTTVKQQFSRHPVKSPHTGSIRSRLNLTWSGYSADHVVALKTGDYNYSAFGFIATTPEKVGGVAGPMIDDSVPFLEPKSSDTKCFHEYHL